MRLSWYSHHFPWIIKSSQQKLKLIYLAWVRGHACQIASSIREKDAKCRSSTIAPSLEIVSYMYCTWFFVNTTWQTRINVLSVAPPPTAHQQQHLPCPSLICCCPSLDINKMMNVPLSRRCTSAHVIKCKMNKNSVSLSLSLRMRIHTWVNALSAMRFLCSMQIVFLPSSFHLLDGHIFAHLFFLGWLDEKKKEMKWTDWGIALCSSLLTFFSRSLIPPSLPSPVSLVLHLWVFCSRALPLFFYFFFIPYPLRPCSLCCHACFHISLLLSMDLIVVPFLGSPLCVSPILTFLSSDGYYPSFIFDQRTKLNPRQFLQEPYLLFCLLSENIPTIGRSCRHDVCMYVCVFVLSVFIDRQREQPKEKGTRKEGAVLFIFFSVGNRIKGLLQSLLTDRQPDWP